MRAPADMPPRRRRRRVSNRGRVALIITAAVLFLLFTSLRGIATFWTDYLWFDSVQLSSVFTTVLGSKIALGAIFTLAFFVLLWVNLAIADRIAPKFRPTGPEDELLDRYHAMVDRRAGLLRAAVAFGFAILAGASVSAQWEQWLLFINAKEFPERDAIFDTNVGFYVFKLPFYSFVVDWLIAAFVIILLVTMVAHYLNGGIRLQAPFQRVTPQVKAHMSVLLAALALLKAVSYWLERYQLVFSQRGTVNGATYTDVKAQLPAIYLLLLISLLACGLFIFNIWQRGWTLPVVAVGLWALVAVVAGVAYPAFVQRFQVTPDESAKERPYIENNIQATRQGFGLTNDRIEVRQFEYDPSREAGARGVVNNPGTIRNVRLLDPERVPDTYNRLQGFQNFYRFADLDVDRYRAKIPGTDQTAETLTVISSRDLNVSQIPQQTWENRVLAYTHGYGVAVANASAVGPSGDPEFVVQDIPVNVEDGIDAKVDQPFLYFGEFPTGANTYAIADTLREEVAYVDRNSNTVYARYQGDGGVVLDSWLRKAAFALRFADWNPLLSNFVTDQSKLIYLRDVHERVTEVAPFLDWDANPYPVMANGRIVYLIDGYTTTAYYPNSQSANADGVPDRSTLDAHRFNYIRNSVKASVDAYDGTIKIYVWDTKDPMIAAYQSAFPTLFSSSDQMPAELFQHVRYPEDLFRVQTNMWGRYRLDNPDAFYQRTGAWSVASDPPSTPQSNSPASTTSTSIPTGFGAATPQPAKPRGNGIDPYYVLLKLPKESEETFMLMREFVPVGDTSDVQQNLTSFMVAKSDPDPGRDYGKLVVYEVPSQFQVSGPVIANSKILQDEVVTSRITQLNQQGSRVDFGNMLMLPLDTSIIWVRPLYVTSDNTQKVPQLKNVIVLLNDTVVMRPTLKEALTDLLKQGGTNVDITTYEIPKPPDQSSSSTTPGGPTTTTTTPGSSTSSTSSTTTPPSGGGDVPSLLAEASAYYDQAEEALRRGDLAEYQRLVNLARDRVRQAQGLVSSSSSSSSTSTTTTTTVVASA